MGAGETLFNIILEKRLMSSLKRRRRAAWKKVVAGWKNLPKKIDGALGNIAIWHVNRTLAGEPLEDKVLFLPFSGHYECNAKYICEEIRRQKLPWKLVWGVNPDNAKNLAEFPKDVKTVVRGTYDFFREAATSRVIVDNGISVVSLRYKKKPGQTLIETWHGAIGIKKFSPDTNKDKKWVKNAFAEAAITDYLISNSAFEDDVYREDYWKTAPIWRFGHARNDILFRRDEATLSALREKVYGTYHLPRGAKLCLYAPTFRDNRDLKPYMIDYDRLTEALHRRFGGEWIILTRLHWRLRNMMSKVKLPRNVVNVSAYPDIQEIMAVIDCGITDYSSWICEYVLTRRPGFFFATDLANYQTDNRAFFFPLENMPFPVATDNWALEQNILDFDEKKFAADCEDFLTRHGSVDDGHAAWRVVEEIKRLMSGAKE